jgi:hypothetical protein
MLAMMTPGMVRLSFHNVNERALAGAEQGGAGVGVLLELGAAGAPHQLPVLVGADRDLAAAVDHVATLRGPPAISRRKDRVLNVL